MPIPSVVDDHYGVLDIDRTATIADITRAYRKLALSLHPSISPVSTVAYEAVTKAFVTLSDDKRRAEYDSKPHGATDNADVDTDAVFKTVFGTVNAHSAIIQDTSTAPPHSNATPPPPLIANVFVRLEDLYTGTSAPCSAVRKLRHSDGAAVVADELRFAVAVGRGWRDGTALTYQKRGHFDGELVVKVFASKHPVFTRVGDDLHMRRTCSLADAIAGQILNITTLDGRHIAVAVTALDSPTTSHIVVGEGMPIPNSDRKGRLIIHFDVLFPSGLTLQQQNDIKRILTP